MTDDPDGANGLADGQAGQPPVETELRKKELIERVTGRSGVAQGEVRQVVEAVLEVLGETVHAEREMNLEPFGRLRINRTMEKPTGRVTVCRVRQRARPAAEPTDPLAEPAD